MNVLMNLQPCRSSLYIHYIHTLIKFHVNQVLVNGPTDDILHLFMTVVYSYYPFDLLLVKFGRIYIYWHTEQKSPYFLVKSVR